MEPTAPRFPSSEDEADDFAHSVRDALRHLHDLVYLQTHPLTSLVAEPNASPLTAAKQLHRLLLDTIAALRPTSTSTDARASRRHELLTLRYIEAMEIADVAARLGISRRQYERDHRQALDGVISLLQSVAASSLSQHARSAPSAIGTSSSRAGRFPVPVTSFIGREQQMREILEVLRSARLMTITGPPGIGKTRLALQIAIDPATSSSETGSAFPDGISFVPLGTMSGAHLVESAIAQALGVREVPNRPLREVLEDHLFGRHMLLILDNFEHVLEAAPVVSHLLAACPRLTVLVTSRSSLRLHGEHEYAVPPLEVPESRSLASLEQVNQVEAVRLYVERARAARSGFRLTKQNAPAVTEICRRLDGLPLAIELAAARSKIFPPYALLGRLGEAHSPRSALDLLSGGPRDVPARQQTLRRAIDWSYQLLTRDEQALLAELSVFASGWTTEAAEAVCAGQGDFDVLEGIASLLDKSLLQQEEMPGGEPRLSMLQTIREYAGERLALTGERADVIRRRHAEYYLAMAREAEANQWGPQQAVWLHRLSSELDNIRSALTWSRDNGETELALQLGGALMWFWHDAGLWTEALAWLESALAVAGPTHRTPGRVAAGAALAICRWRLGDVETARAETEEGLAICRELGDRRRIGHALHGLGVLTAEGGDLPRARALIEEGLFHSQAVGDDRYVGLALHNLALHAIQENDQETARARIEESRRVWHKLGSLECLSLACSLEGDLARSTGAHAEAAAHYREALRLLGETGPRGWRFEALHKLGHAMARVGNDGEARTLFTEALFLCRELDDHRGVAQAVAGIACLIARDEPQQTVRLLGAARAATSKIESRHNLSFQAEYDHSLGVARAQLGDEAFDVAWTKGQCMTLEQAVIAALDTTRSTTTMTTPERTDPTWQEYVC